MPTDRPDAAYRFPWAPWAAINLWTITNVYGPLCRLWLWEVGRAYGEGAWVNV